jgi:PAS domain S-box-containing protein
MPDKTSSLVFLHYLTTVFDNISDAILLIGIEPDEHFRLLLANEAFNRNTGHPKSVVGKLIDEVVTPESYTQLKPRYKKVIADKQPLTYTEWFDVPLGRQAFEVKLIPILNAVGQCVQIAAITRNVTELHDLRAENKKLRVKRV